MRAPLARERRLARHRGQGAGAGAEAAQPAPEAPAGGLLASKEVREMLLFSVPALGMGE